jgi:ABC-2 type transport system ATP-binding protein
MTTHAPLSIQHVTQAYGKRTVLKDVSLELREGEIFGLIGLNGAGKTTLIKSILDLIRIQSGSIHLFGEPSTRIAARRELSYLPEKFQPSRYLKGTEYLSLALSYYRRSFSLEAARAQASALDLNPDVLSARVGSYSKGMGQKLGLLGAFLVDTRLLILDEPMSGLDPSARIKLKEQLLAARARGRTVFFSSHILSDIDEICDRIGVIHDGVLFFTGTPAAFKAAHGGESLEKCFLQSISAPLASAA